MKEVIDPEATLLPIIESNVHHWDNYIRRGNNVSRPFYLVTGWVKTHSWGAASMFECRRHTVSLSFFPHTEEYSCHWMKETSVTTRAGPQKPWDNLNQCVFIRGYQICSCRPGSDPDIRLIESVEPKVIHERPNPRFTGSSQDTQPSGSSGGSSVDYTPLQGSGHSKSGDSRMVTGVEAGGGLDPGETPGCTSVVIEPIGIHPEVHSN